MSILCYVKLYEGQHPFNNGIHLKPKGDHLVCWKIQECEWKLHRDPLVHFKASHGQQVHWVVQFTEVNLCLMPWISLGITRKSQELSYDKTVVSSDE